MGSAGLGGAEPQQRYRERGRSVAEYDQGCENIDDSLDRFDAVNATPFLA